MNSVIGVFYGFLGLFSALLILAPGLALASYGNNQEISHSGSSYGSQGNSAVEVGQCFLSASKVFKLMTESGREMPVVDLEVARDEASGCPQLRNYSEVQKAYDKLDPNAVRVADWTDCAGTIRREAYDSCMFNKRLREAQRAPVPQVQAVPTFNIYTYEYCASLATKPFNESLDGVGDCNGGKNDYQCMIHHGCEDYMYFLDER